MPFGVRYTNLPCDMYCFVVSMDELSMLHVACRSSPWFLPLASCCWFLLPLGSKFWQDRSRASLMMSPSRTKMQKQQPANQSHAGGMAERRRYRNRINRKCQSAHASYLAILFSYVELEATPLIPKAGRNEDRRAHSDLLLFFAEELRVNCVLRSLVKSLWTTPRRWAAATIATMVPRKDGAIATRGTLRKVSILHAFYGFQGAGKTAHDVSHATCRRKKDFFFIGPL